MFLTLPSSVNSEFDSSIYHVAASLLALFYATESVSLYTRDFGLITRLSIDSCYSLMIGFSRNKSLVTSFFATITLLPMSLLFDKFKSEFAGFNDFIACVVPPFILNNASHAPILWIFLSALFVLFNSKLASCPLFEFLSRFLFQQVASILVIYTVLKVCRCVLSHPTVLYGKNDFDFSCQLFSHQSYSKTKHNNIDGTQYRKVRLFVRLLVLGRP